MENAGNPHYLPTAGVSRAIGRGRAGAPRSLGQAGTARRGLRRYHVDGVHGPRRAGTLRARRSRAVRPPATPPSHLVQQAVRGRTRRARLGGRPRGVNGAQGRRLRRRRSCTGPATASARRSTATASTWTTTRPTTTGGCCPGTGFTIEPGVYLPEFGVRSEINMVVGDARRDRHRAQCSTRFWLSVRSEERCPLARPRCSTPC